MAFTWSDINNGDSASSIRTKLNSLGSQVVTNTNNITTNTTDITTNTTDITTNTTDITNLKTKSAQLNVRLLTFTNLSIATTAWVSDSTYTNYPYKAPITCTGVLATDIPLVQFAPTQQESGQFIGASGAANTVYVWSSSVPTSAITIPLIMVLRVVS